MLWNRKVKKTSIACSSLYSKYIEQFKIKTNLGKYWLQFFQVWVQHFFVKSISLALVHILRELLIYHIRWAHWVWLGRLIVYVFWNILCHIVTFWAKHFTLCLFYILCFKYCGGYMSPKVNCCLWFILMSFLSFLFVFKVSSFVDYCTTTAVLDGGLSHP